MAKKDYELLAEFFPSLMPRHRTLRVRLEEMALRNKGMLEREGKQWCLWIPDEGEWVEPNLQEMQRVMVDLWPHEFPLDNVKCV